MAGQTPESIVVAWGLRGNFQTRSEGTALLQPDAILAACREVGYTTWRDRVLTPVTTIQLFLWQILHGNTAGRQLPY